MPGDVARPRDGRGRRGDGIPPGCPWSRPRTTRRSRRSAPVRSANDRARLARHLHRVDGARAREPAGRAAVLDELRLPPAPIPVREPRHPPRHVDAHLVHGPARAGVRRAGSRRSGSRASSTSSARPQTVPAGSDGLMTVLDWLAPTDKPFRKGVMLGFDARHTRGHVYRSILEAIALTMKDNVDAMCGELGIALERDRRLGRRCVEPAVHADLRRRLRHPGFAERRAAAARASAPRSARPSATGVYPDFETAVARMAKPRESFDPERRQHRRLSPHERRRLSRHPRGDRPGPRTVLPALPLSRRPDHERIANMALSRDRHRRGTPADPRGPRTSSRTSRS